MRTDPLALAREFSKFVTTIHGLAVTFAFLDVKAEAKEMKLISAVDGIILNWCEHNVLRELMRSLIVCQNSRDMAAVSFNDHFRDRMSEVDRGHIEVFPKLQNGT